LIIVLIVICCMSLTFCNGSKFDCDKLKSTYSNKLEQYGFKFFLVKWF